MTKFIQKDDLLQGTGPLATARRRIAAVKMANRPPDEMEEIQAASEGGNPWNDANLLNQLGISADSADETVAKLARLQAERADHSLKRTR